MAKSRIKSEEEYRKILGDTLEDEKKTTNDANEYFSRLKAREASYSQPSTYKRVELKKETKPAKREVGTLRRSVENVKNEIASAQTKPPSWYKKEEEVRPAMTPRPKKIRRDLNYNSNAQKLYENLRSGKKATPTGMAQKPVETSHTDEATIQQPTSVNEIKSAEKPIATPQEVSKPIEKPANTQPSYSYGYKPSEPLDSSKITDESMLDLTADFTRENKNFIEAVNQQKKIIRTEAPAEPSGELKATPPTPLTLPRSSAPGIDDTHGISSKLDEQLELVSHVQKTSSQPPVSLQVEEPAKPIYSTIEATQPENEPALPVDHQLEDILGGTPEVDKDKFSSIKTNPAKSELQNTLKLALDPEHSSEFTNQELKILSDDSLSQDIKPKKKTSDIVITVILIIAIIVALYLLITSFI